MNDADMTRALREALDTLAGSVDAEPRGYSEALRTWRRREHRRKLILAALIVLVFATATLIGLWVLNHSAGHPHNLLGVPAAVQVRSDSSITSTPLEALLKNH